MKPQQNEGIREEIAQVHTSARSPSPKAIPKSHSRSRSKPRRLSNSSNIAGTPESTTAAEDISSEKSKSRDTWIKSEQESLDAELPIHDQIKQDILGFVEKEIKKSDKNPSFVFYSHDPKDFDEKLLKTSRPSSSHKEKRSPSYRRKKRHSSKHRDLHDFELPVSSLSALEKVDDYLKEYNMGEEVTLSGELEIEANDVENNNRHSKDIRHKSRKTKRKSKEEQQNGNTSKEISPKVFKSGRNKVAVSKIGRPTDFSSMLNSLESNVPHSEQYVDNPFSSPSPLTSPNDDGSDPFHLRRPEKVYMQGGGTFTAVSRDRIIQSQQSTNEDKFLRLGDLTPVDIALIVQGAWRSIAHACHGMLGGLSLMHLLLISYSDGMDAGHLSFHAVITMPYVAAYYFLCILCMVSVLDRLDATSLDMSSGLQQYFQPIVLVILYTACLIICTSARMYDELMVYQYTSLVYNITNNVTTLSVPMFYYTWTHFSVWRAVLSILGLVYFVISNPRDAVYSSISKLMQYKPSLQTIE